MRSIRFSFDPPPRPATGKELVLQTISSEPARNDSFLRTNYFQNSLVSFLAPPPLSGKPPVDLLLPFNLLLPFFEGKMAITGWWGVRGGYPKSRVTPLPGIEGEASSWLKGGGGGGFRFGWLDLCECKKFAILNRI